ncbi:hypothetical protein DY000_02030475 [Brassica cretica]|uniref:Uncharacterized protein n=1 Tax=Brassica cretica TaxID=69181 RepID=A0ABQ7E173_BRACR|nr:hypothetical protein DY000_02030475 [Brassica cretica]
MESDIVFIFRFAVGCESEDSQIELLLKEVSGKDLCDLIATGREKLASVPSGGGSPAAEAKKEEKKEEKEESDDDMGFSLFE